MSKFKNVTRKTILAIEDSRLDYHDMHIMNDLETICINKGFTYINIRRIIVSTNNETKEPVHTNLHNGIYITIDFITKKDELITDEMKKMAMKFVDGIDSKDSKLNAYEAALYMEEASNKMIHDKASFVNLANSTVRRMLNDVCSGEQDMHRDMVRFFGKMEFLTC